MAQSIAVVYVTYDGAVNSASGVGVLSRYFVDAMPSIVTSMKSHADVSFHVVAVKLSEAAGGYSPDLQQHTATVCSPLGGRLHLIDNGLGGQKGYGSLENWQLASANAAVVIQEIAQKYDRTIAYLVDTPFMCLPFYSQADSSTTQFVVVPHSDTFSHFPDTIELPRLGWEAASMQALTVFPNVYLAKTSEFLLRTLKAHYKIDDAKVISLQTGLVPDADRFRPASAAEIRAALQARAIPLDKPLIFSVGRAVPYKGFTDLIESFALLKQKGSDAHLVFIAPPHKNEIGITDELEALIAKHDIGQSCTPIYDLDMELPRLICQWKHTRLVAQLSHREPFGLVPEEVRLWTKHAGPVIVASNLDGFVEQIDDGVDGFLVPPHDHQRVAAIFQHILECSQNDLAAMREKGWQRAMRDYNYTKAVETSLNTLLRK